MSATINVFLALLRVGLWNDGNLDVRIDRTTDWDEIYQLAQEQSVQGVVLQGIEELRTKGIELNVPKILLLQWIGEVQAIEQRNKDMNAFIAELLDRLRNEDIYAILVKGQGIAQCYGRPLWRVPGDIDLLLDISNYEKAKLFFRKISTAYSEELLEEKHCEFTVNNWSVELHGDMPSRLIRRIDKVIEDVQEKVFSGEVRYWDKRKMQICLPSADNDIILVFTHVLKHFFREGIGLRQVCDFCRLLWTYSDSLNYGLLEQRIKRAGIMSEWKAFAALVVYYLGMSKDAMPFYSASSKWESKAERILDFIMETGNFGHNRDTSYYFKYPFLVQKAISFWRHNSDIFGYSRIFPVDSIKIWVRMFSEGIAEFNK